MADTPITDDFKGIPMEFLIAAPLAASIKAQRQLGHEMVDFVNLLAYGANQPANGQAGKVLSLPMGLERPVINTDNTVTTQTVQVNPPILGLVPIPALLINSVDISFSMEIHSVVADKDTTDASLDTTAQGSFEGMLVKASLQVTGKVATQRENTRSTDKTAKYDVTVHASQQEPTEGMSKLMDLLASTVEPIVIKQS